MNGCRSFCTCTSRDEEKVVSVYNVVDQSALEIVQETLNTVSSCLLHYELIAHPRRTFWRARHQLQSDLVALGFRTCLFVRHATSCRGLQCLTV